MSEFLVLVGRRVRSVLRGGAFFWSALFFGLLLALSVLASPAATASFVPALWPAALVFVAWSAAVGATGADALPADRASGRTTWLRTLAPPGWKDRVAAAVAGMSAVVVVGCAAAIGLGVWAVLDLDDFVLRTYDTLELAPRELIPASKHDGAPGDPWVLALPRVGDERLVRRVHLRVRPYGDVRRSRASISFKADTKYGELDVATRGAFTLVVPATARRVTLRNHTSRVGLRVRNAAILGQDRAPAFPIGLRVLWMSLLVASTVPLGIACSRFTSGATAGALMMCVLLFSIVRQPLLDLVRVLRTTDEPSAAISMLKALGRAVPDLPLFTLASDTADGRLVSFGAAAPWLGVLTFAAVGMFLVWLPLRRERRV